MDETHAPDGAASIKCPGKEDVHPVDRSIGNTIQDKPAKAWKIDPAEFGGTS